MFNVCIQFISFKAIIDQIKCHHFASDFILFGVDYFQTRQIYDGVPNAIRLIVGSEIFNFKNITNRIPDDNEFELPPKTQKCHY